MLTITKARIEPRPQVPAPRIREVCLVGDPRRRYVYAKAGGQRPKAEMVPVGVRKDHPEVGRL